MNRTMSVFVGEDEAVTYMFDENEIGAPNTRDCFTLAKRLLQDMGVPKDTLVTARLFDGYSHLASSTFTC